MICTTVDENDRVELFSRAEYLVLIENGKIVHKERNPALDAKEKRPTVAKRCVDLGAQAVIAAHGSLCLPSYLILARNGKAMYAAGRGEHIRDVMAKPANAGEVVYSSLLAIWERLTS